MVLLFSPSVVPVRVYVYIYIYIPSFLSFVFCLLVNVVGSDFPVQKLCSCVRLFAAEI